MGCDPKVMRARIKREEAAKPAVVEVKKAIVDPVDIKPKRTYKKK